MNIFPRQFTTTITAQQRRDMWEWDKRRRCPWLYEDEEVDAGIPSGTMVESSNSNRKPPAAGSAPVAGSPTPKEK